MDQDSDVEIVGAYTAFRFTCDDDVADTVHAVVDLTRDSEVEFVRFYVDLAVEDDAEFPFPEKETDWYALFNMSSVPVKTEWYPSDASTVLNSNASTECDESTADEVEMSKSGEKSPMDLSDVEVAGVWDDLEEAYSDESDASDETDDGEEPIVNVPQSYGVDC